ncbi:MAG: ECF-type sigma factor [Gemmatimonadaceae bacterium]
MPQSGGLSEKASVAATPIATLTALQSGSADSLDQLVPVLYQELRAIAHRQLARRPGVGTLETTGLVHEAYLKVADNAGAGVHDRAHLLALSALAMRHVLVDHARARGRLKRGGSRDALVTFDDDQIAIEAQPEVLLQLDEALVWLATLDPRLARVVECRFFGGLSEAEVAMALGVTERTVQRDWAKARMLLRRALQS